MLEILEAALGADGRVVTQQAQALVLAAENPEATVGSIVMAMPIASVGLVFGGLIYQHRQDIADAAASALNAMAKAEPREVTMIRARSAAIHQLLSPTQVQAASTAPPVTPAEAAPAAEEAPKEAGYWPGSAPGKSVAPPRTGTEGATAKGGTYKLRDPETGQVRRTGRTNDLKRREGEHSRSPETRDLDFEVDKRTDSHSAQRGREQRIWEQHPEADLNRKQPIDPKNPRREEYLREGDKL